nr:putative zinc-binding protein [Dyella jiangningensis]
MANHFALRLDRERVAKMSCIAGVGGGVPGLVRTAQSGRRILALDGCEMRCAVACLARAGVVADAHLVLSEHGVKKRQHVDFEPDEARRVYVDAVLPAAHALAAVDEERNHVVASA